MKKSVIFVLILLLLIPSSLGSTIATDTLYLLGTVGPRHFLEVSQIAGETQETAIPLDSGDAVMGSPGLGANVGSWSVSSNSQANLVLVVEYTPFEATVNESLVQIPYTLNNGSTDVTSGSVFKTLVRTNGVYSSEQNSGSIYIKRTNTNSYPPSNGYLATITFILSTE
jgi:hypothetical protein